MEAQWGMMECSFSVDPLTHLLSYPASIRKCVRVYAIIYKLHYTLLINYSQPLCRVLKHGIYNTNRAPNLTEYTAGKWTLNPNSMY